MGTHIETISPPVKDKTRARVRLMGTVMGVAERKKAGHRHFQVSTERRNSDGDDHLGYECVIGPKTCLTGQLLPVTDLWPDIRLRLELATAIASRGRRHGGFTNCEHAQEREITFVFFQSFEGSVRAYASRRSS